MNSRRSWVDIAGLVLGAVALASTAFAAVSIFGAGPLALPWGNRTAEIAEGVTQGIGRGLGEGLRVMGTQRAFGVTWKQAEGQEAVAGSQTALTVTNISGLVRISGWDQDTVQVKYVKQARTQADLADFKIEILGTGDTVTVRPIYAPAGGMGRFGSVDFDISVPRRIGRVSVHNTSGAVEVSGLPGPADQELVTVSGAISTAAQGNLTARTTSGALELDFSGDSLRASTVSGRIRATVRSLGSRGAELGTISGSVEVDADAALDAALNLHSLSGSISCDFPVTIREQSRGTLKGDVGKGTTPFSVSTTSGSIKVRKR
jgi:hypothetical protein